MKLGICCNFSYRHIGGSEIVLKQISERLVKNLGYEIYVFSFSVDISFSENGVNYIPCKKGDEFVSQINKMDHIFVYSDSFWEFDTIILNIDKIKPNVTIAMVGMYHMEANPGIYTLFKSKINRFRVITHSRGKDYIKCISDGITVNVIPNGVDLSEFESNNIDFKKKYNIKEKNVFLNVSNFFYGKGQELISAICKNGHKKGIIFTNDTAVVFVYNSIKYRYAESFLNNCKKIMQPYNSYFLQDMPREDVVAAFKCSDVFLFTSKKEVSPLVILESQAAGLPWISMDVGDVGDRRGGIVIPVDSFDLKGYKCCPATAIASYVDSSLKVINDSEFKEELIKQGKEDIIKYDWSKIYPLYDRVFKL